MAVAPAKARLTCVPPTRPRLGSDQGAIWRWVSVIRVFGTASGVI